MRVVFMGTPDFAATVLEDLAQHHEVVAVYTRPDAVRARGNRCVPSPVKEVALRLDLCVRTPRTLRDAAVQRELAAFDPDVICVAAYGALLPKDIIDLPRYGCLNVHASLLPRWRGAAPVERAILAGDVETGVCIMRMEEGLDTGAYCVCRTAHVEDKTAAELTDELANLGSHALLTALVRISCDAADWTEQDDEHVVYAPKIARGELDLHPEDQALRAVRKVRASSSAHPARARIAGRSVTVSGARIVDAGCASALAEGMKPGMVRFAGKRLLLGVADGSIEVCSLKPDGRGDMDARAFAAGVPGIRDDALRWDAAHE